MSIHYQFHKKWILNKIVEFLPLLQFEPRTSGKYDYVIAMKVEINALIG